MAKTGDFFHVTAGNVTSTQVRVIPLAQSPTTFTSTESSPAQDHAAVRTRSEQHSDSDSDSHSHCDSDSPSLTVHATNSTVTRLVGPSNSESVHHGSPSHSRPAAATRARHCLAARRRVMMLYRDARANLEGPGGFTRRAHPVRGPHLPLMPRRTPWAQGRSHIFSSSTSRGPAAAATAADSELRPPGAGLSLLANCQCTESDSQVSLP